jgi:hypothetical protein
MPGRLILRIAVATLLAVGLVGAATARADGTDSDGVASCPAAGSPWNGSNPWCYPWQTDHDWLLRAVNVPSPADGKDLTGTEFRPTNGAPERELPAIAILHGLGGKEQSVWWLARYLAGRGYVVLTATTASNSTAAFTNAMQAMVDYLRSSANPYAGYIDRAEIGAAGHSAGARAASWVQDNDYWNDAAHTEVKPDHVATVVALDNLTSDLQGDPGTYLLAPQCTLSAAAGRPVYTSGFSSEPIAARVPSLGMASDDNAVTCPERAALPDPSEKEAAWSVWRHAGLDSVEFVLGGTNHLSFDQDVSRTVTGDAHLQLIGEITKAWFDAFLRGKGSALAALIGPQLFGAARSSQLSAQLHSAVYLPDRGLDCPTFETASTCAARRA